MTTDATRDVWERQLEDVQRALDPHVIRDGDWVGIDPTTAPTGLVDLHAMLIQVGYIKGWVGW